jgi:hypothetical protein
VEFGWKAAGPVMPAVRRADGKVRESLGMQQIHQKQVFALYAQIALFDAEDQDSYPQWETGTEEVIFGPKGVAVATAGDTYVDVVVYKGQGSPGGRLCGSGEILVGKRGLLVGNVPAADITPLEWSSGKTSISVYVDDLAQATQVMFLLDNLGSGESYSR